MFNDIIFRVMLYSRHPVFFVDIQLTELKSLYILKSFPKLCLLVEQTNCSEERYLYADTHHRISRNFIPFLLYYFYNFLLLWFSIRNSNRHRVYHIMVHNEWYYHRITWRRFILNKKKWNIRHSLAWKCLNKMKVLMEVLFWSQFGGLIFSYS